MIGGHGIWNGGGLAMNSSSSRGEPGESEDYRDGLIGFIKKSSASITRNVFLIGLLGLVWFALRTGTKPSRAVYPCQQAAATNSFLWLAIYVLPVLSAVKHKTSVWSGRKRLTIALITLAVVASVAWGLNMTGGSPPSFASASEAVELTLSGRSAEFKPASDVFVVNGTFGDDRGVTELIDLMGDRGSLFYKSPTTAKNKGPAGIIASDDTVIIKVNSQWDERGGTNTDLLESLIEAIVHHPNSFIGEIIVADNGQAQYGPTGSGGSLGYERNNADDIAQSVQNVVDSFASSYDISTYLWDTITTRRVNEYYEGDVEDGYVVNTTANPRTGAMVSYPKFKTRFGTHVSFKLGIWDPQTETYDNDALKVINVPVLKSHMAYGVTACVKHYMGVVSDKLTAQLGARAHNTIGAGGMGTEMVETRFPVLNIIDAIWVNANPAGGPRTPYDVATRTNVIAASTDPVALDYWAAKHILLQASQSEGHSNVASIDPDNTTPRSFGHWLRLSMQEISRAGFQATADEAHMNIYVFHLRPSAPTSPDTPTTPGPAVDPVPSPTGETRGSSWAYLTGIVVPLVLVAVVVGVVAARRKRQRGKA